MEFDYTGLVNQKEFYPGPLLACGLDPEYWLQLASCDWIRRYLNLILTALPEPAKVFWLVRRPTKPVSKASVHVITDALVSLKN